MKFHHEIDVSVLVPVYGGVRQLRELCVRTISVLKGRMLVYEIILIDDCGPGNAWTVISELATAHSEVRGIRLMRNFGQHNALMCGLKHAKGAILVTIDDDLQQEPESIPLLIDRIHETDADLVYGRYQHKRHSRGRNLGSWIVSRFYRLVFSSPVAPTSFRAFRHELGSAIQRYDLNFTYLDGLLAWNTQRVDAVQVPHHKRMEGCSGYSIRKLLSLAFNMFTNFSLLPLQLATAVGFFAATGGLLAAGWYLVQSVLSKIEVPGYASIIISVMVLGGLQLLALGMIGEYVGRIHMNLNRKPQYSIRTMTMQVDE